MRDPPPVTLTLSIEERVLPEEFHRTDTLRVVVIGEGAGECQWFLSWIGIR